jgi:adenylate cyclase
MQADSDREIERKFLLTRTPANLRKKPHLTIEQGYLAVESKGTEVRLRRKNDRFFITVKSGAGVSRQEREVSLRRKQFAELWPLTAGRRLSKLRYRLRWRQLIVEIDVYQQRHKGLVVAEVEFADERASRDFEPPAWFGREITGNKRFKNRTLAAK